MDDDEELTKAIRGEIYAEKERSKGALFTLFLPDRFAGSLAESA